MKVKSKVLRRLYYAPTTAMGATGTLIFPSISKASFVTTKPAPSSAEVGTINGMLCGIAPRPRPGCAIVQGAEASSPSSNRFMEFIPQL